jgi:3-deoxy-D-manno-octulosonic-acid transferase
MLYGAYRLLTNAAGPFIPRWLDLRARRGKEDPARLNERRGQAVMPRPAGRLVWFHAASIGEALSILPLVDAAASQSWNVLVTTGTVTSARLMAERLPTKHQGVRVFHQFAPLDRPAWIRAFLDHWSPDLVLWTESELWPNTLTEIAARKIPAVLLNARLSDKSFRGWKRWPGFAKHILGTFALVIAQSDQDKQRFANLGAAHVVGAGNLKHAAAPLPCDEQVLADLRAAVGKRPHWLASSIHPGEDIIVAEAHYAAKARHPGLLTVIVPRHPARAAEMSAAIAAKALKVARRSAGDAITADVDIYIGDTLGELGLFYRLCDLVFMGKSLAVGGGQNPAEPAHLGCALLLGADMSNFRDAAADFIACGAAIEVRNGVALAAAVDWLLQDDRTRKRMGEAARAEMTRHAGATRETLTHLGPFLAPLSQTSVNL